jgi:malonyl-CoA O-methyltransferase
MLGCGAAIVGISFVSALYRERLPSSSDASAELVLLHGWGSCSEIWRPLLPALRANFSVTVIDLPGCGRSPLLADMSVESVVQALLAQLPARALYVGWSLGGLLAGELALAAPDRVSGLVRLASNLRFVANEQWPLAMPAEDFAAFYTGLLEQPEKTRKRFNTLQLQGDVSARALRRLLPPCHADPEALRWGLDCLRELDQRETYAGLSCPVMNIYGSDDALVPAALAETVPAARSRCYGGAGHIPFLSQPEQFVSDIIGFEKDFIPAASLPSIERHFEKCDVARSFSRAANSYDRAATLQRRVADELFSLLAHQRAPQTLVDLGCGTGYSLPALRQRFNDAQLIGVDLAEGMLAYASEHHSEDCQQWVCGDAEDLPLADASIDLLFSSLSLQWCENVSALFSEIDRVLAPGGKAFIATLGPETLFELREAWQNVDGYAHVNRFIPRQALDTAIAASGLRVQWRQATEVLYYPTVTALTRELKQLGVSNVNRDRPQGLASRKRLQALQQAYETFRQPAGLPASYQVWYLELDKQP